MRGVLRRHRPRTLLSKVVSGNTRTPRDLLPDLPPRQPKTPPRMKPDPKPPYLHDAALTEIQRAVLRAVTEMAEDQEAQETPAPITANNVRDYMAGIPGGMATFLWVVVAALDALEDGGRVTSRRDGAEVMGKVRVVYAPAKGDYRAGTT